MSPNLFIYFFFYYALNTFLVKVWLKQERNTYYKTYFRHIYMYMYTCIHVCIYMYMNLFQLEMKLVLFMNNI